ncbi:MAG: phosphatase PAP2 family protein [Nonlabens sp.]
MWDDLVKVDQDIFRFLNNLWIGEFEQFWLFVTQIENWIPLYLFFFFLLFRAYKKPVNFAAILSVLAVAGTTLTLTNLVKNQIARLRPNNEPLLVDSIRFYDMPENFSFWSGHSAVSCSVATFTVILLSQKMDSKWIYLIYIWPLMFALSRIFVGVHYPADVIVGILVGMFLGYAFAKAFFFTVNRLNNYLSL